MAATPLTGRIERKYMAHFIDAAFSSDPAAQNTNFVRLGKDLEEYSIELNPDTETGKNILGETYFRHNGYDESSDADPYYAVVGDPLFEKLQSIVDNRDTGDQLKTYAVEAHLWEDVTGGSVTAYAQECYVVPNSYGGDTSGYQIPFSVNYTGSRIRGTFNPETKKFTADAE